MAKMHDAKLVAVDGLFLIETDAHVFETGQRYRTDEEVMGGDLLRDDILEQTNWYLSRQMGIRAMKRELEAVKADKGSPKYHKRYVGIMMAAKVREIVQGKLGGKK